MYTLYTNKLDQSFLLDDSESTALILDNGPTINTEFPHAIECNNKKYKIKRPRLFYDFNDVSNVKWFNIENVKYTIYTERYGQSYLLNDIDSTALVLSNNLSIIIDIPSDIEYKDKKYKVKLPDDCNELFTNNVYLKYFTLGKIDTSNVTNTFNMFDGCCNLETIDVSNFDTSNISDITAMFANCKRLTKIDISNFNLNGLNESGKKNLRSIFMGCLNLKKIRLPKLDIPLIVEINKYSKNLIDF